MGTMGVERFSSRRINTTGTQYRRGERFPSHRQEQRNILSLSLSFLSEKPSLIAVEDRTEKSPMKPIDMLMQKPERERALIADEMLDLMKQLLKYDAEAKAKLLPTPQAKIISKLRGINQDIPTIARRLYARLELPVPEEFALKSGNKD